MGVLFLIIRSGDQYYFFRDYWFLIFIPYIPYIIEVFCSSTFRYLWNKKKGERIYDYVIDIKKTKPVLSFWCECFHYETRFRYYTVTVRNSDGSTST